MSGCVTGQRQFAVATLARAWEFGVATLARAWESQHNHRLATVATTIVLLAGLPLLPSDRQCGAGDNILGPAHATLQMPLTATSNRGFTTQVQMAAENSVGYLPVKIVFQSVGMLTADRRLTYRFETSPGGQSPPRNGLTIDVPITVPQGTTTRSFIRYLPKWSAGQAIEVSVWEDGRMLPDYTVFFGALTRPRTRAPIDLLPIELEINWVFISSADRVSPQTMPDLRGIAPAYPGSAQGPSPSGDTAAEVSLYWSQVMYGPQLLALGQQDLPDDWRAYQRYDAMAIDTAGLELLRSSEPEYQAVRKWVLQGGTIVIYDANSAGQTLEALDFAWTNDGDAAAMLRSITAEMNAQIDYREQMLRDEIARLQSNLDSYNAATGVNVPGVPQFPAMAGAELAAIRSRYAEQTSDTESAIKEAQQQLDIFAKSRSGQNVESPIYTASQWSKQVWMQPAGAGNVIGILARDQYEVPSVTHWQVVAQTIDFRASPMLRRGVDPLIGDRRFANWLIPGVAQPPVYTFMALLTGFVILVGPIAYRKTAKVGRSYLMFGIAPVLALFTTLAMFGYGIVSDGFGTVVRARQLTWVDSKSGDAGERIRATYFAGVRPEEGLRFPGQAEVSSYPEGMGHSWEDLNKLSPATIGKVSIRPDAQQFDSSFLPSRQQRQFVVHAPRRNLGSVQLVPDPDRIRAPRVDSTLEFMLHEAVLRDRDGVYWYFQDLAAGQSAECRPLLAKEASKILGRIYTDDRPMSQVRETRRRNLYRSETFDVLVATYRRLGTKMNVSDGLFEHWLRAHLQTSGEIPRNHFVATADVSPDAVAVMESELVDGIRYVFGTLR
jgi:hypothetical protein